MDARNESSHPAFRSKLVRKAMMVLAALSTLAIAEQNAVAQEEKDKGGRGAITLTEVTITGRIEKPIAAVDVARISPRLTLAELRQPFLDRIEQAIFKSPF